MQFTANSTVWSIGAYGSPTGINMQVWKSGGVPYLWVGQWQYNSYSLGINLPCSTIGLLENVRTHLAVCRNAAASSFSIGNLPVYVEGYQHTGTVDHLLVTNTAKYVSDFTPPTGF